MSFFSPFLSAIQKYACTVMQGQTNRVSEEDRAGRVSPLCFPMWVSIRLNEKGEVQLGVTWIHS